jgi:CBS domain-containing protein
MHEIEEIMSTDVVSVTPDTPVSRVIELLVENDITGIPVVDSDGQLAGVVSEKDVMGVLSGPEETWGHVRDYMTGDAVSFDQNDDVIAVCESLVNNHFRRVPILNEGHLVGIISRRDLIKYIIEPIRS